MSGGELQELCESKGAHYGSTIALQRKLLRLQDLRYIKPVCPANYIGEILDHLAAGKNVVIEFGSQGSLLSYMLAANILTRRIHEAYVRKAELYLQTKSPPTSRASSSSPSRKPTNFWTPRPPARRSSEQSPARCASTS